MLVADYQSFHNTKKEFQNIKFLSSLHVPSVARGDTFREAEELTEAGTTPQEFITTLEPIVSALAATTPDTLPPTVTSGPTLPPADLDAAPCSGRPFDAFLQLNNGSIYAFRGKHGQSVGFLSYSVILNHNAF